MKKLAGFAGDVSSVSPSLPGNQELWFKIGYHIALDETGAAVELLKKLLASDPYNAAAHLNLGVCLRELDELDTALFYLGCAAELEADNAEAAFQYGTSLAINGEHKKAQKWLLKAVELVPDSECFLFNLAMNCLQMGKKERAMLVFAEVLRLNPENLTALYNTGLYNRLNRISDLGLAHFTKIINLNPSFYKAYQQLMRVALMTNSYHEAVSAVQAGLQVNPDKADLILDKLALDSILNHSSEPFNHSALEQLCPDAQTLLAERIFELKQTIGDFNLN